MKIDFVREIAIKTIYKIEEEKAYSNIILDEYLNKNRQNLENNDINLISEIVYGVITWKLTIDTIIQKYSKIKIKKISKWILNILRTATYQIIFLDKIPKSAAVNESVNLAKKYGKQSTGFVNAILRKIEKNDYEELKQIKEDKKRISKLYSMPEWIVEELIEQYGKKETEQICKELSQKPELTIRINTLKITKQKLLKKLEEKNIKYEETQLEDFINLKNIKNISKLELFNKGLFTIQDKGAGQISIILDPKPEEQILDACSAPGGKTTHIAQLMKNKGEILAWDIHEHRTKLVEDIAHRLDIKIIKAENKDATKTYNELIEKFDKILLDVPCLGIGAIKRKPDIKWKRKKEDIEQIQKIQLKILNTCSEYLKKGGEIVYSTCSLLKQENEKIIGEFLKQNKIQNNQKKFIYTIEYEETILPQKNSDGFYICKIKKN
ncbi:MAG: 16S rRNA (cytosine(967)-C(5))-methyltransferase RsmB [Clostridia bacterium]|jgi:16S rRNA (cytosine967-C5)-methyltransferase|nr:16S rRNA (cytosine(967)-C(5))-methyltransferase RsmB [Clostridia bacterium]